MDKILKFLCIILLFVPFISTEALAHPGRTDANGGHVCRTNCEKWGLKYGEYHYHNGNGSSTTSSSPKTTTSTPVQSSQPKLQTVNVYLNGQLQSYDQPAIIKDGRTLVPLRPVSESLGATVDFHQNTGTITIIKDNKTITLTIGSNIANINGENTYLDVPPQIINQRTMVPLRFISETFGATVLWDGQVNIYY